MTVEKIEKSLSEFEWQQIMDLIYLSSVINCAENSKFNTFYYDELIGIIKNGILESELLHKDDYPLEERALRGKFVHTLELKTQAYDMIRTYLENLSSVLETIKNAVKNYRCHAQDYILKMKSDEWEIIHYSFSYTLRNYARQEEISFDDAGRIPADFKHWTAYANLGRTIYTDILMKIEEQNIEIRNEAHEFPEFEIGLSDRNFDLLKMGLDKLTALVNKLRNVID